MGISAIIGDDMTGCMDAGVQLTKKGYCVNVAVNIDNYELLTQAGDVVIVDTESRNIKAEDAYRKVKYCIRSIYESGYRLIYKKVDSTLRGNIGSELMAVLQSDKIDLAVFVAALPYNKRTTRDGIHYLDSKKLTENDIAKDPFSPLQSAYIPEIIGEQVSIKTTVVNLYEVRRGINNLALKLEASYKEGYRIAVVDAEAEEDLIIIADALKRCEISVLACGSAGLLSYILDEKSGGWEWTKETFTRKDGPILVLSGSPAEATKLQIKTAANYGVKVLKLDITKCAKQDSGHQNEFAKIKKEALWFLSRGEDIVIDGAGAGKTQIYEEYKNDIDTMRNVSQIIQSTLSEIFDSLNHEVNLGGAVIVGGDTAFNICNRLSVRGLKIIGEVEPFVPCGKAIGGKLHEMNIITKAGGFGSDDVILKSIKHLKGEGYHG